jgi:hypothetical protein
MRTYKIIPRAQISKLGWASLPDNYSMGAYKAVINSLTVVSAPSGLKDEPKSAILNNS